MANPITWQNVAAPDFRGSLEGLRIAGNSFDRAFSGMGDALTKFDTGRHDEAASALINNSLNYGTPEELRAAQASGALFNGVNRGLINPAAATALDNRATSLLNQATGQQQLDQRRAMAPLDQQFREGQVRGQTQDFDQSAARFPVEQEGRLLGNAAGRLSLTNGVEARNTRLETEADVRNGRALSQSLESAPDATTAFALLDQNRNISDGAREAAQARLAARWGVSPQQVRTAPGYAEILSSLPAAPPGAASATPVRSTTPFTPGSFYQHLRGADGNAPTEIQRRTRTDAQFSQEFGPAAEMVARRLGTSPEAVLAHWSLETHNGSKFAGRNNLGNMTALASQDATEGGDRDANGTPIRQRFLNFSSPEEFANRYASWVERRPEVAARIRGTDAQGFAAGLQSGGYATSPTFVSSVSDRAGSFQPSGAAARTGGSDFAGPGAPPSPAPVGAGPALAAAAGADRRPTSANPNYRPDAAPPAQTDGPAPAGTAAAAPGQPGSMPSHLIAAALQTPADFRVAERARTTEVSAILNRVTERQAEDITPGIAADYAELAAAPSSREAVLTGLRAQGQRFASAPEAQINTELQRIVQELPTRNYALAGRLLREYGTASPSGPIGRFFGSPEFSMNRDGLNQEIAAIRANTRRDGSLINSNRSSVANTLNTANEAVGAASQALEQARARAAAIPGADRYVPVMEARYNAAAAALQRAVTAAERPANRPNYTPSPPAGGNQTGSKIGSKLEDMIAVGVPRAPSDPNIPDSFDYGRDYGPGIPIPGRSSPAAVPPASAAVAARIRAAREARDRPLGF
ncbi:glucosaminidase domain-containing protein [Roseococcus sp.]|uniref:glucosaminidase domain-containing protein n=1 Tax=Roseococcus sp. TaxID=2109646 RepID=UPI003BA8E3A7